MAQLVNLLPVSMASHMGPGLCSGCSVSVPVLAYGLNKQQRMAKCLGTLQLRGRPRRGFQLLA